MGGEVPMIQSKWGKVQKIRLFPFWGETKNLIPRLCPKDRSVRPMVIVLNDLLCWCGERWPTSASQSEARMGGGRVDSWVRAFCTPLKNQKWWWRPWWYNSQHPKGLRRHGATAAKTNTQKVLRAPDSGIFFRLLCGRISTWMEIIWCFWWLLQRPDVCHWKNAELCLLQAIPKVWIWKEAFGIWKERLWGVS